MKKSERRRHSRADGVWQIVTEKSGGYMPNEVKDILLMDLRAALHDMLYEQRETNRILRMAFGVEKKEDE